MEMRWSLGRYPGGNLEREGIVSDFHDLAISYRKSNAVNLRNTSECYEIVYLQRRRRKFPFL